MRLTVTCVFLLSVLLAVTEALPAGNLAESKSLEEKDLNIEDAGADKDRSKKSAASFCVEIRPGSDKAVPCLCKDQQHAHNAQLVVEPQPLTVVQSAPQMVPQQTFNLVSGPQPVQQSFNIVPAPQPAAQSSSSLILPAPQPVHTLHFVQSAPQPCVQPAVNVQPTVNLVPVQPQPTPTFNIIQPAPQPAPQPIPEPEPMPEPAPRPVAPQPKPEKIIEIVKPEPEQPKPTQVVNIIQPAQPLPEPTETLNVMPVEPACEEQVVMVPKPVMIMPEPEPRPLAAIVQVPTMTHQCRHKQQHALLTECSCHPKNVALLRSSDLGHMQRTIGPLYKTQQRMDHRAMQPWMVSGSPSGNSMMLLNRAIRSEQEQQEE